jgi:hypothetical protein
MNEASLSLELFLATVDEDFLERLILGEFMTKNMQYASKKAENYILSSCSALDLAFC